MIEWARLRDQYRRPIVSAIIPMYDELGCCLEFANRLDAVLQGLRYPYEVIFDVGGDDGTIDLMQDWVEDQDLDKYRLYYHGERGLGRALMFMMKEARGDWVLSMDSDMQQDPRDIPLLFLAQQLRDHDLIIGAKDPKNDSRPLAKKLLSRAIYTKNRVLHGIPVRDQGSNFRLYTRFAINCLTRAKLHTYDGEPPAGYSFQQWSLRLLHYWYFSMSEVPTSFAPRASGRSKMSIRREIRERLPF